MCNRCFEFDQKISHYRRIAASLSDKQTLDGIATLIREMTESKSALHSTPKEQNGGGG
jgi:hypothetical protein